MYQYAKSVRIRSYSGTYSKCTRNNEKNQNNSSRQIWKKLDLKSSQRRDLQDNKENNKLAQGYPGITQ